MITTDKDKNLSSEGQRKYFVLMFTVIFITLILATYIAITLWLVFLPSTVKLNCASKILIFGKYVKQQVF